MRGEFGTGRGVSTGRQGSRDVVAVLFGGIVPFMLGPAGGLTGGDVGGWWASASDLG